MVFVVSGDGLSPFNRVPDCRESHLQPPGQFPERHLQLLAAPMHQVDICPLGLFGKESLLRIAARYVVWCGWLVAAFPATPGEGTL